MPSTALSAAALRGIVVSLFFWQGVGRFVAANTSRPLGAALMFGPAMAGIVLVAFGSLARRARVDDRIPWFSRLALVSYLGIVAVTLGRGAAQGAITAAFGAGGLLTLVTLVVFLLLAVDAPPYRGDGRLFLQDLVVALGVYVLSNFALWIAGVRSAALAEGYLRSFETRVGISSTRALFPLATGINTFASEALVAGAGAIALVRVTGARVLRGRQMRDVGLVLLAGSMWIVSMVSILIVDSRLPLVLLALVSVLVWARPGLVLTVLRRGLPIIVLFPVLWLGFVYLFATRLAPALESSFGLSTSGIFDLLTLNNRVFLWLQAATLLLAPVSLEWIVGYGAYGHVSSGLVDVYGPIFSGSYGDVTRIPTHNSITQHFVDTGAVGVIAFVTVLWLTLRSAGRLQRSGQPGDVPILLAGLLSATLLGGLTETASYVVIERIPAVVLMGTCGVALWARRADRGQQVS